MCFSSWSCRRAVKYCYLIYREFLKLTWWTWRGLKGRKRLRHPESGCVRAHSKLDEVLLGTPKLLYRKFQRLGIYNWKDVFAKANNNLDNPIMALRFCKTEMLDNPYPWNKVTQLLAEAGIKTQLQSPCRIPANIFFSIASSSTH